MSKLRKKNKSLYRALTPISDYNDIWPLNQETDDNSTVKDESIASCYHELSKDMFRSYGRDKLYNYIQKNFGNKIAIDILKDCADGFIKIHDLHNIDLPYCYAFSMAKLVFIGLPFLRDYNSNPPTNLREYVQSVVHFVGYASNQLTGAVSLPDFFVYFDWFARKQKYKKSVLHQLFHQLISCLNYEYRGNQPPFTNINLYDHDFLEYLFKDVLYPDATKPDIESIYKLQQIYIDWLVKEFKNKIFTFPVHTVNFHTESTHGRRKIIDTNFLDYIAEKNCHNGLFNIYTGKLTSMSSCCRLRSDLSKLPYQNSLGAGGISIGSHRVVTLNLPLIALCATSGKSILQTFDSLLDEFVDKCIKILKAHRQLLEDNIECNLLPLYDHGFMHLEKQFSTIGFIGLHECCQILDKSTGFKDQCQFTPRNILRYINFKIEQETDAMYNVEQIPGETTASELFQKIKKIYPTFKNGSNILSNQYIPLTENVNILDRIKYQGALDGLSEGGSVAHLNLMEPISKDQMLKLIKYAVSKGCIYFAFNMNFVKCSSCEKIFIGKFSKCPDCSSNQLQNYTRIVGFITPVNNWTNDRQTEYLNRKFYSKTDI